MISLRDTFYKKSNIEIYFLSVILLFYLFRAAVPEFKYPFLLFLFVYLIYVIIEYRFSLFGCLKTYFDSYYLILLLVIIFYLSAAFSNKLYLSVFKEAVEILLLLTLFYLLTLIINTRSKLELFITGFYILILVFASAIALLNSYVFIELVKYCGFYPAQNYQNQYILGSLLLDKNFALVPVFFGFVVLSAKLNCNISKTERLIYNLLLLFFSFHIILSTSRRGLILLFLLLSTLFILRLYQFFASGTKFRKLISNLTLFYISGSAGILFLLLFFQYGSYELKTKTIKAVGIKDITSFKRVVTSSLYNSVSRIDRDLSYSDFNNKLWSVSYDPKDPDNGWGYGYYKTIFPLPGNSSEIVPQGSIGYLLDYSCTFGNSDKHAFSNTIIANKTAREKEMVEASVFCYVSSDFNGDQVCLRADGKTYGNRVSWYDINLKGTWQKLSILADCTEGDAPVSLYFNKLGVVSFQSLSGHVIFAYPLVEIKSGSDIRISDNSDINIFSPLKPDLYFYDTGNAMFKNEFLDPGDGNSESELVNILPLDNNLRTGTSILSVKSFFSFDYIISDSDLIRSWFKDFIKEDTTYTHPTSSLIIDTVSTYFIDDRLSRWQFAFQIFSKEYSLKQKLLGGGFKYLNWFGYNFLKDKTSTDYPHNPFLSILLYSGIIGLLIYIFLIYRVFYYYLKYLREYPVLFIFFIITFFFSFFSGANPFDPPIMGFFIILPFFIHSVHKKDLTELT